MMQLLEGAGCPVVVQRGRRVFPATEKASDVTRTLARLMQQSGVEVRYGSRVQALMTETAEDGALHGNRRSPDGRHGPSGGAGDSGDGRVIVSADGFDGRRLSAGGERRAHDDPAHGRAVRD